MLPTLLVLALSCCVLHSSRVEASSKDILVLYLYSSSDPQYNLNLDYFIKEGMTKDTRSDFYVLVPKKVKEVRATAHQLPALAPSRPARRQSAPRPRRLAPPAGPAWPPPTPPHPHPTRPPPAPPPPQAARAALPALPRNARYLHDAPCSTFGAFGWALYESGAISPSRYSYFVMMDATTRGPFVPVYARDRVHWAEPFLRRLSDRVKLVGPTISCQPVQSSPKNELPKRDNPYVQVRRAALAGWLVGEGAGLLPAGMQGVVWRAGPAGRRSAGGQCCCCCCCCCCC
jgi:hypothetical protein